MASKKTPAAALQYLDPSFFEHSPKHKAALEETRSCQEIGRAVYDLRTRSGLSARELARAAGMTPRALEKLENGENPRQSLAQLRQVAAALGKRVELKIVGGKAKKRAPKVQGDGSAPAHEGKRSRAAKLRAAPGSPAPRTEPLDGSAGSGMRRLV